MNAFILIGARWSPLIFVVLLALLGGAGCGSTEPGNASARPWNAPRSWETGLPSSLTEGR